MAVIATRARRGDRHRDVLANPEIAEGEADANELRDDREEIQDQQVAHRERAPEAAETLLDEPAMAHASNRAQSYHHLLVDDEHRDEQREDPQQRRAVVLPGLGIRRDPARVVVPDHDDDPWADYGGESEKTSPPAEPGADVLHLDSAKGALDVPNVFFVKDRSYTGRDFGLTTQPLVRHNR